MNKKLKAYYFPSMPPSGYGNPYSENFKHSLSDYFYVLDEDNRPVKVAIVGLIKYLFSADIFFLNWIEGIGKHRLGTLQYYIAICCLKIIKYRHKKIVWVLHNIHPHEGKNRLSENISKFLYRHADIIITHSKAAASYAFERALCPVKYYCHPFSFFHIDQISKNLDNTDVLIWGSINPYKGILEFLTEAKKRSIKYKIKIVGVCKYRELEKSIRDIIAGLHSIVFENRKASFEEISGLVQSSRFVLFPYVGESVSSSGALIDTLSMYGNPVGPNIGAFRDLKEEGLCFTYSTYDELFEILETETSMIPNDRIKQFINSHQWKNFGFFLYNSVLEAIDRNL